MILADYTFGQGLLTVLEIFLFAAWLMVLFTIFADLFRDHQMSGWGKAAWVLFLIFVPFLAALIYLIARGSGMRERALAQQQEAQKQLDPMSSRPRAVAPPPMSLPSWRSSTTRRRSPTRSTNRPRPRSSARRPRAMRGEVPEPDGGKARSGKAAHRLGLFTGACCSRSECSTRSGVSPRFSTTRT